MAKSLSVEEFLKRSRRLPFNNPVIIAGAMRTQCGICRVIELRWKHREETMNTFIVFRSIVLHSDGSVTVLPQHIRDRIADCKDLMTEREMMDVLGEPFASRGILMRPVSKPLELITEQWPCLKVA